MKSHNRECFYKYLSPLAARAVLETGSFRWSSPRMFNDPFDIQYDLHLGFTEDEIHDATIDRLGRLAREGRRYEINAENPTALLFNSLLDILNQAMPGMSDAQIRENFSDVIREGFQGMNRALPRFHAEMRDIQQKSSVFCVSEIPDSLLMWSHYADSHRGVVLKLNCLPEQGSALCVATPVKYQEEMPKFATLEDWLDSTFGVRPLTPARVNEIMTTTKSLEWAYEKEWRLVSSFRTEEETKGGIAHYPFFKEEIGEVVLGCRMSDDDKHHIARILAVHYPHVELFQARTNDREFKLDFERLSQRAVR